MLMRPASRSGGMNLRGNWQLLEISYAMLVLPFCLLASTYVGLFFGGGDWITSIQLSSQMPKLCFELLDTILTKRYRSLSTLF